MKYFMLTVLPKLCEVLRSRLRGEIRQGRNKSDDVG